MKIAVIGASAGIGIETVKRALERNHEVTALSRSAIPLPEHAGLNSIMGDALDENDLRRALEGAEAVLVTLGTRKNMDQTTLFSDFAKLLLKVQQETQSKATHLLVTGFGTGESAHYVGWFVRLFLKYFLKDVYADKAKMEELVSGSTLQWIMVRPGRLTDAPRTEKYRVETTLYKGINIGAIHRSDVADYLVKQAEHPTDLFKYAAIAQK